MAINNNRIYKIVKNVCDNPRMTISLKANDNEDTKKEVMEYYLKIKNLLKKGYDPTTVSFIISHDINEETMSKDEEAMVYSPEDVNRIIKENYISKTGSKEKIKVSISDIVGSYDQRSGSKNILDIMSRYYKYDGDKYSSRDNDFLNFESFEEAIKKLKDKPIDVKEYDKDNYVVSDDGIHKYMILKMLYLNDYEKGKVTAKKLKSDYLVPVTVEKVDLELTYSQFIIRDIFGSHSSITRKSENKFIVDLEYGLEGNYCKEVNRKNIKTLISEAFEYLPSDELKNIKNAYQKYDSFKEFIDENYSEYKDKIAKTGKVRGH